MWLILMKFMFAYIALEFGSQLHNFVFQPKYIRECHAKVLMVWYNPDHTTFEFMLLALLLTCQACLSLISSLPICHLEPNMNKIICFIMLTPLLSFCKCWFTRVCGKILVEFSFIELCFLAIIHSFLVMPYSNRIRHNPPSIPQTSY
jgi:hypothetical protein